MKQDTYRQGYRDRSRRDSSGRGSFFPRGGKGSGQQPLNTGVIHIPPFFALLLGGAGFVVGLISNCVQVWTSQNAAVINLVTSDVFVTMLKRDPAHAAGLIPTFNGTSWFLAIAIQLGVLFFTLRVTHDFKEQMSKTQGKMGARVKAATKATAVQVAHQRDFLFYYGCGCFIANCYGDYTFVWSFTDSVTFLIAWGIVLTATSTLIMAVGAEFLWAGYNALRYAMAEWKAAGEAASNSRPRAGRPSGREE